MHQCSACGHESETYFRTCPNCSYDLFDGKYKIPDKATKAGISLEPKTSEKVLMAQMVTELTTIRKCVVAVTTITVVGLVIEAIVVIVVTFMH